MTREEACTEEYVFSTDRAECRQAADVLVFSLMDPLIYENDSVLVRAWRAGARPQHYRHQIWVGLSYEAADWVKLKSPTVLSDAGAAAFDYLFVHENGNLLTHWDLTPIADSPSFHERQRDALLLVSNCGPTPSRREELLKWLSSGVLSSMKVDSLGECWRTHSEWPITVNNSGRWANDWDRAKITLLQQYRFEIIMQNALCANYIDEKLVLALRSGAIPIWLGPPEARDRRYEPADVAAGAPESIIYMNDFKNVDQLQQHIERLLANRTLAASYHAWRRAPPARWPRFVPPQPPIHCRIASLRGKPARASSVSCAGPWSDYFAI